MTCQEFDALMMREDITDWSSGERTAAGIHQQNCPSCRERCEALAAKHPPTFAEVMLALGLAMKDMQDPECREMMTLASSAPKMP